MRRAHYLTRNKRVELPQHMIFVDTETKGTPYDDQTDHHRLWFGWATAIRIRTDRERDTRRESWLQFTTPLEFWEWVGSQSYNRTRTWVLAHNWNFDAGILDVSRCLPPLGWELATYINDKPPFIVTFKQGSRTLQLVDTLNYFAGSLEAIGESIGIPKLPMPSCYDSQDTWNTYCRRDVSVIRDAFLAFREFVDAHSLGNFQSTLASQAFTAYRHRYLDNEILISGDEDSNRVEREGYYGGRVECFQLGKVDGPLYCLDVNSLYPSIMAAELFPTRLWRARNRPEWARTLEYRDGSSLVAQCQLETDEPVYATRRDHRLVFPVGRFRSVLSTPEFDYALERGHILKVERLQVYDQDSIFRDYVETLYELRQAYQREGNETFQYMCKILLNSLYGKFGQNGQKWQDAGVAMEPFTGIMWEEIPDTGEIRKLRYRLGRLQEMKREGEAENSFPAIAAHVTAYGRMKLWSLIQQAGRDNVFYMDTDSLIVTEAGYHRLSDQIEPGVLGQLKVESVSPNGEFHGPKDYTLDDKHKAKGIKKSARQVAVNRWEQEKFVSWDYQISKGLDGFIPIQTISKTLHRVYRKGTVLPGGRVEPLVLKEF